MTRLVASLPKRLAVWLALLAATSLPSFVPAVAKGADCPSGRKNKILITPGCTFGNGELQVDSVTGQGVNGEHTVILFFDDPVLGPSIQNSSDWLLSTTTGLPEPLPNNSCGPNPPHTDPCSPEKASLLDPGSDPPTINPSGVIDSSVVGTVSTVSGLPEIGSASVTLLSPTATGGGSFVWSLSVNADGQQESSGPLDETTSFSELTFPSAKSIAATFHFTLSTNCTPVPCAGDASLYGAIIHFTPAPEPSAAAAQAAALGLLAALARRPARRLMGARS